MTVAYAIGLCLGALISAFIVSRALLWLGRRWSDGDANFFVANAFSLVVIVGVSIVARGDFDWAPAMLHLVAQGIWLCFDWWRRSKASGDPVA